VQKNALCFQNAVRLGAKQRWRPRRGYATDDYSVAEAKYEPVRTFFRI